MAETAKYNTDYFYSTLVPQLNELLCNSWEPLARQSGLTSVQMAKLKAKPGHEVEQLLYYLWIDQGTSGLNKFINVHDLRGSTRPLNLILSSPCRDMFGTITRVPAPQVTQVEKAVSKELILRSRLSFDINTALCTQWKSIVNRTGLSNSEIAAATASNPGYEIQSIIMTIWNKTGQKGLQDFKKILIMTSTKECQAALGVIASSPAGVLFG